MPLRRASKVDLPELKAIKDDTQTFLYEKGSLQELSNIDETAVDEYWLFVPAIATNSHDAAVSKGGNSDLSEQPTKLERHLLNSLPTYSESMSCNLFSVGSCRISAHAPSHIEPHLQRINSQEETRLNEKLDYIYLSSVLIRPEFQRAGLGRQMIRELQQQLLNNPMLLHSRCSLGPGSEKILGFMTLDVWAGNSRLRQWYEQQAWRYIATVEEREYPGDPHTLHDVTTYDVAVYVWP